MILSAIAHELRTGCRPGDVVGRWGGDEFVVLLPGVARTEAVEIAERLRSAVAALDVEVSEPAGGGTVRLGVDGADRVTVTIGVAIAPDDGNMLEDVLHAADQRLMPGKELSRNAVYTGVSCSSDAVPAARMRAAM